MQCHSKCRKFHNRRKKFIQVCSIDLFETLSITIGYGNRFDLLVRLAVLRELAAVLPSTFEALSNGIGNPDTRIKG